MATLSHAAFRRLIERFGGCDEFFGEMINAPSLVSGGPFESFYTEGAPAPEKLVRQLTGKDGRMMAAAAGALCALEGLGIDVNMGCSAPEIVKSGAGIAWMLKPMNETEGMVRAVRERMDDAAKADGVPRRLSVKLRLGADDFTDAAFFAFCDMLVGCGVELLTLHPRTQKEKDRDAPRYQYAEALAVRYEGAGVRVYVNGGIRNAEDACVLARACPHCAGLMIGQAAVQKPWIFAEIRRALSEGGNVTDSGLRTEWAAGGGQNAPLSAAAFDATENTRSVDLLALALSFMEDLRRYQPEAFWKTRMQRFFSYYCKNLFFGNYLKGKLLHASDMEEAARLLDAYFSRVQDDRFMRIAV